MRASARAGRSRCRRTGRARPRRPDGPPISAAANTGTPSVSGFTVAGSRRVNSATNSKSSFCLQASSHRAPGCQVSEYRRAFSSRALLTVMFRKVLDHDARTQPASSTCADQLQQSPHGVEIFWKRKEGGAQGEVPAAARREAILPVFTWLAHATGFIRTNTNGGTKRGRTTAVKSDAGSIIIETINDQGNVDNSPVRAPKAASPSASELPKSPSQR